MQNLSQQKSFLFNKEKKLFKIVMTTDATFHKTLSQNFFVDKANFVAQ
jgi:hypothetical protein